MREKIRKSYIYFSELVAMAAPQNQQKQKLMSLGFKETEATQALLATVSYPVIALHQEKPYYFRY